MTLAGLARAGSAPAHSADVLRDGRLADSLLAAAGASAALAVPVRGKERGHGVLLVAGRTPRHFTQDEIHFLETVANVVATSVDARAAQEALRGRERLARAVFDHARDGLAIVDRDGRCLDANAAGGADPGHHASRRCAGTGRRTWCAPISTWPRAPRGRERGP